MDIMKLIEPKDQLSFSQNLSVVRSYLGDRLFPDNKTQNLIAEFYRLSDSVLLPTMAKVHAFDTEANIGTRPTFEKVKVEKFLIKEKINQSERVQQLLDRGVSADSLVQYVYDDMGRLAESVKTRTEVAKMEVLQSGKMLVDENNVKFEIDYGVPTTNKQNFTWNNIAADILGDIQKVVDKAKDNGQAISKVITSNNIVSLMRKNEAIQKAIFGTQNIGMHISLGKLNELMQELFGFAIETYDERYRYEKADGSVVTTRYIKEDKFIMLSMLNNSVVGTGLWGVTPEEIAQGPWTEKSAKQYITLTMWSTPDPVAVWTKASGVFVPVLPNPQGLFIATIK